MARTPSEGIGPTRKLVDTLERQVLGTEKRIGKAKKSALESQVLGTEKCIEKANVLGPKKRIEKTNVFGIKYK